jgi:acyl-CoA reductase-like NAD-dependent aldehyde dehydrogenase
MERLDVAKTYKLYLNGAFPRSESGRSLTVQNTKGGVLAHIAHASRKDLRDAVEAARAAQPKWAGATAYNRGQVLYRLAEMMEGKRDELARALSRGTPTKQAHAEVAAAIDRMVHFAGWCDKYAQVLGCNNPVSGPFYNFTSPEPTGVVCVVCPDACPLLAMVSLLAPVLAGGNAAVVLASDANPLPSVILSEACATSDVPAGVVNILTGQRAELLSFVSGHRDIDGVHAADLPADQATLLREGSAENLKRVLVRTGVKSATRQATTSRGKSPTLPTVDWFDDALNQGPWWIEPFVEFKTMWHPSQA